jgi:hypothetical protein
MPSRSAHLVAIWAQQVQHCCLPIHQLHLARIPHTHAEATHATCAVARQHHTQQQQQQQQQKFRALLLWKRCASGHHWYPPDDLLMMMVVNFSKWITLHSATPLTAGDEDDKAVLE